MRHQISCNIRWLRYPFAALGLVFIIILYSIIRTDSPLEISRLLIELLFISICAIVYIFFDNIKKVEFDNEYMYVTSKTTQEKIPLKDIYKVKLTMMSLNYRSFWKIGYIVDNNSKRSVRILEKWKDQNFIDFKDLVRSANKKVIIKNWSYIFDFDQ